VKARYVGVCRGCGAYTRPRNGKGDVYRYCKRCNPVAARPKWTRQLVVAAMLECGRRCPVEAGMLGGLAEHECRHGRLPFDRTGPCGCWPEEGAVVAGAAAHGSKVRGGPPRGVKNGGGRAPEGSAISFFAHGSIQHVG
jgi:hypothetical protein